MRLGRSLCSLSAPPPPPILFPFALPLALHVTLHFVAVLRWHHRLQLQPLKKEAKISPRSLALSASSRAYQRVQREKTWRICWTTAPSPN